ncbi:MAG: hypothetical protein PHP64_00035 [Actinomycetota bacterium]|nr:hypothetical protein [Actinomycetota bacterium]
MKHIHYPLNQEIRSIGGYYKILEEGILDFQGDKVLFNLKAAHVDNSCCGSGGVGFISVLGYIVSWKSEKNEEGYPVTEVRRIKDKRSQGQIREILKKKYPYMNIVEFD